MILGLDSVLFWHILAFALSCALGFGSAIWTYRRTDRHAAGPFFLFLVVTVAWNATVLLRIVGGVQLARQLHLVEQFFQVSTPIVWFYFAAIYAGYHEVVSRSVIRYPLAVLAAGMLVVDSFPPVAAITYVEPTVIERPFAFVTWTDTALAETVEVLALGFAAIGSGLILYKLVTANYVRAWQVALVFGSTSGTILLELLESGIPNTVPGVDYPALAVTGVGVSYLVGLYRYDLFGYTPVDMSDVIDGITAPVIVLNPERRVVDFNAPASATFGALARGRVAREVLPEALVDAVPLDDIAESETEVKLTRDGEERIYRLYAAPLDSFGDSRGVAVTVRDVTTQRRQQENLDLLKQILTRALRHNIRNEVDIVKANSRELVDRLDGDDRERALAAIDAADDLLSISAKTRVMKDVAQNRGRTTTVDLSSLLDEIVAEYKQAYPDTSFLLECPPECPVAVTPDIRHALRNLIENAAEHNPTDTAEVRVTLERKKDGTVVEIADNGPGIPTNDLTVLERGREHVLEHGSGIGLWIVTLVVEEIDGTIQYDTGDDGTTITLRIKT